jgi:hypothetical protein
MVGSVERWMKRRIDSATLKLDAFLLSVQTGIPADVCQELIENDSEFYQAFIAHHQSNPTQKED